MPITKFIGISAFIDFTEIRLDVSNSKVLLKSVCSKKIIFFIFLFLSLAIGKVYSQTFLGLDGGFEGSATIDNTGNSTGAVSAKWTRAGTVSAIANETSTVRSGSHSMKISSASTTSANIYSPQFSLTSSTSKWVVQYYRRSASTTNTQTQEVGVYRNTTLTNSTSYTVVSAANAWEKVVFASAGATAATTGCGVILNKATNTTGGDVFVDDFIVYLANAEDATAPSSATSVVAAQNGTNPSTAIDVSWTAASGGVDNGGYMVVRYATTPNADNDPNVNGIYAVNNTINNGTGALTGTVVYVGTALSFTNTGLTPGLTYYYKVYTYDKAYNYAAEASGNATTQAPSIVLSSSNPAVSAANLVSLSTKNPIYRFTTAITNANATLTGVSFTTANSLATDITKYQLWYNTADNLSTASQVGTDITSALGTGSHSFSGFSQSINAGSTGYFWITTDIDNNAINGDSIKVSALTTADLTFMAGSKSGTAYLGGKQTIVAPLILLSSDNLAVPAGGVLASSVKNQIYKFSAAITSSNATINTVAFTTTNSPATVVSKYQLWYKATDSFSKATQIGTDITIGTGAGTHTFSGLTQIINSGTTGYFWITADISSTAVVGDTVKVSSITTGNIVFAAGNKSGTIYTGGTQTVITTASAPTITTITPLNASLSIAFTAPTSNGSSLITNYQYSINNGSTYTNFSPAQSTSPLIISGLSNGVAYTIKIKAVNAAGAGLASNAVSGTPIFPPVISSVLSASSVYGTASTYAITASNSPTSYNATGLPSGMTINTSSGVISIAANTGVGVYNIKIFAYNGLTTGVDSAILVYTVIAGPPKMLSINNIATQTAGNAFSIVVNSTDEYGNLSNVTDSTTIALSLVSGSDTLEGNLTGIIPAGSNSVTFSNLLYYTAEDTVSVAATKISGSAILSSDTSAMFSVSPNVLYSFSIEDTAGGDINPQTINVGFPIKITAQDAYDNTVTSFVGQVKLTSYNGVLSGGTLTTSNFINGVWIPSTSSYPKFTATGFVNLVATAASNNAIIDTSNTFEVGNVYYSRSSGNWNSGIWATTPTGTINSSIRIGNADVAVIQNGNTVTVTSVDTCKSVQFNGASATLSVNTGVNLYVVNEIKLNSNASVSTTANITGTGSVACQLLSVGNKTTRPSSSQSSTVNLSITKLDVSDNVYLYGRDNRGRKNTPVLNVTNGTIIINGNVNSIGQRSSASSVTLSGSANLSFINASPAFLLSSVNNTGTVTFSVNVNGTSTWVNYNGSNLNQIIPVTYQSSKIKTASAIASSLVYKNLSVSNGGVKTFAGNATIGGSLMVDTLSTLQLDASNRVNSSTINLLLNGGTLQSGVSTGYSNLFGTITLSKNSMINLGSGSHTITFSASSAASWTTGKMLTISGWTGVKGLSGTAGKVFIGSNNTGVTSAQLAQIQFYIGSYYIPATILSTGEIVPMAYGSSTFTSSGTFVVPAGITCLKVEAWGAGGGGGSRAVSSNGQSGGGGGGAYASSFITTTSGASIPVNVGVGGTAGNNGGSSSFNTSIVVAAGGLGVSIGNVNGAVGGSVGNCTGTFKYAGGAGGTASGTSGGGGGGAGSTGNGGNATVGSPGSGASENGGNGGLGVTGTSSGNSGSTYGGGGSGASSANGTAATGGSGANGLVRISWIDVSSFTISATSNFCSSNLSTVTVSSSSLNEGTYTVVYNLSGANNSTGNTATMVFSNYSGSFSTIALSNGGNTTITITSISLSGWSCGTSISSGNTALVTVYAPPSISVQPTIPTSTCSGNGTQILSVTASGTGLSYIWRKGGVTLSNNSIFSGVNTATLTITNPTVLDTGRYDVVITGTCSPSVTSNQVVVSINQAPVISVQPIAPTPVCVSSGTQTISVTATGASLTYRWRKGGVALSNNSIISGATTSTLTITNPSITDTGRYDVVVTGTCSPSVTSNQVVVSLNTAPVITVQPSAPASVCVGNGTQIMSVTATGTGLTYTWRKSGIPLSNNSIISGATTSTLTLTNPSITDTGRYDVVVSGSCSPSVISNQVTVSLNTSPSIIVQPVASSATCPGNGTQTFSVTAIGTGITYQWRKGGVAVSNNSIISGATSSTLTLTNPAITDTGRYDVVVSGTCAPSVTSNQVVVSVTSAPVITTQPFAPTSTCTGTGTQTISVIASGSGLTYSWRKYGIAVANSAVISGQGTSALTLTNPTLSDVGSYDVLISGACGLSTTSTVVSIAVNNYPSAPSTLDGSRCATGTVDLSASVGNGETADWYASLTGGSVLALNTLNFTTPSISSTTSYYASTRNTSTGCVSTTRTLALAIVNGLPISPTGINGSRCSTGAVVISATAGVGETIDWYSASTGGSAIAASTNTYTTPSISIVTTYYASARNTTTGCLSAVRTAVIASPTGVQSPPIGTNGSRCGSGSVLISASAGSGETIDWYAVPTGGTAIITSSLTYTTPAIGVTTTYYASLRNISGGCSSSSRTAVVAIINNLPPAPTVFSNARCGSGNVALTASVNSGNYINWYDAASGGNMLSSNANSYTAAGISSTQTFYVSSVNNLTSCTSATRVPVIATIYSLPSAPTAINASICDSGSIDIAATYGSNETVDWYDSITGGTQLAASSDVYTIDNLTSTTTYYAVTRNTITGCVSIIRTPVIASLTIVSLPTPSNAWRCGTGAVTISANVNPGETIDWYSSVSGGILLSSANSTYTTPNISFTTTYYAQARNLSSGCISSNRVAVIAQIRTIPVISGTTPVTNCGAGSVVLAATPSVGSVNWYSDVAGGNILFSGNTYTSGILNVTTTFFVEATNNGCISVSRTPVIATIKPIPNILTTTPGSACQNNTITLGASVDMGTINWYTTSNAGSSIATGSSYTTPSLTTTTTYYVGATYNGCSTPVRIAVPAIISLNITISVNAVSSEVNNRFCIGKSVMFTAIPQNGGTSPTYQWKLNGINVGTNSNTYTPGLNIRNHDTICVQMTSTLSSCNSGSTVTSNKIIVTIDTLPHIRGINGVCVNNNQNLYANPVQSSSNATWTSTNTNIALVESNGSSCSVTGLSVGQTRILYTDNNGCADTVNFSVYAFPGNPTAITGPQVLCRYYVNTSYTDTIYYHITPVSGAANYNWILPKGSKAVSPVIYNYRTTGSGISVDSLNVTTTADSIGLVIDSSLNSKYGGGWIWAGAVSEHQCASKYVGLRLYQGLPSIYSSSGPSNVCDFFGKDTVAEYRVNYISGGCTYDWQIPAGVIIVSTWNPADSGVILVKFTTSYQSGNIRVRIIANCMVTPYKDFVLKKVGLSAPSAIYGPTNICNYYSNGAIANYSVPLVRGATSYHWFLPASMHIVGSTFDSSSIYVTIDSNFTRSVIKVIAYSSCSISAEKTLIVQMVPSLRTGVISGPTNACMYYDTSMATYSTRKVSGSPSYLWTVPSGITIVDHPGGLGTQNDTIIKVRFNPNLFVFGSSIYVSSSLGCNTELKSSLAITGSAPSVPYWSRLNGPKNVCEFKVSNTLPNGRMATYYIDKTKNASSYIWTVPANTTVIHPAGSGINDTVINVIYNNNFTSGVITVNSINGCFPASTSNDISINIVLTPASMPSPIIATSDINLSCNNRRYHYSISSLPTNATSVLWQIPSDVIDFTGQGTTSISVLYPPSISYTGAIGAKGVNNCSVSSPRVVQVNLSTCNTFTKNNTFTPENISKDVVSTDNKESAIEIFPNPSTNYFNLKVKDNNQALVEVLIRDMQGRIIQQSRALTNVFTKLGEGLKSGCYIIEIKQGVKVVSRKIVKM